MGGGSRLLPRLGDHNRHGLMVVLYFGATKEARFVEVAFTELARVLRRHDGDYA